MLTIEGPIASSAELLTHVVSRIESGEWMAGDRLPSVRRLAEQLGLAPNTVAKAYRELEAAGWVHTAGRRGTLVASREAGDVEGQALALARAYAREMRGLGLTPEAMVSYLNRALVQAE
ncbi:GntR family transcriptional regulator [Ammonicoccus fulvus]|uniref:GntR family transcriptional regulator n=1 Tax=Ammonicoccus fulvus TaxID=3138240 RepID=A0ABZ3FNH3_9ACTN